MELIFFLIFAVIAIASAVGVVTFRNPVHSALSLIICFLQVAALFILLRSPFLAVMQVFIYVGAVVVLFLFAVLILNLGREQMKERIFHGSPLVLVVIVGFVLAFVRRNKSIGSMKSAERKAKHASMDTGDPYSRGTQSIDVLYIASFLPDFAIGAFRAFLGLENDDLGFN